MPVLGNAALVAPRVVSIESVNSNVPALDLPSSIRRRQTWTGDFETTCQEFSCTPVGSASFNSTLQSCACPEPQCPANFVANCSAGEIIASTGTDQCSCVEPCTGQSCQFGVRPSFNETTRTCLCPALPSSCNGTCPAGEELQFNATTHQCSCALIEFPTENPTVPPLPPVPNENNVSSAIQGLLTNQSVTSKIKNGMAQIYSAAPDFYNNIINFTVILPGSSLEQYPMAASATILTGDIDSNSLLILSPAHTIAASNTTAKDRRAAMNVTQVIAVQFNQDKTVSYHCQLWNGTVVLILSDSFVDDIDSMDPSAPPELSITVVKPISPSNTLRNEFMTEGGASGSETVAKRGIGEVNAYTAIVNKEACAATICTGTGEPHYAMFNPYRRACYCLNF